MKLILLVHFCFAVILCSAQITVTHGPIVGGVTDTSCNVFVRTSSATPFTILLSNTIPFGSIVGSAAGATNASLDTTAIVHIGGLTSNTKYSMRLTINGAPVPVPTVFSTLCSPDSAPHQIFLTGACIDGLTDVDSAIFSQAGLQGAKGFINLGNWGYPDATEGCTDIYLSNPPSSWAATYSNVQALYKQRYSSSNSLSFIQSQNLDFVYDDHDYMNEKAGQAIILAYEINIFGGILGSPLSHSQPAACRPNSLQGYKTYFPSYSLPDTTDGIYHSFRSGDAEFFVLDTRSARGFQLVTVDTVGSTSNWAYVHDSASHLLGNTQMAWLKNSLSQSSATWKFIVSSVPFNMAMQLALDTLIKLGNTNVPYWNPDVTCDPLPIGTHAYSSTNHFADMWAGFKADEDSLLNYVLSNNIPNVFVISGNTGTVGLDDGANSGLPELMSGNMKITNSEDALNYQNFMGFNAWDLGGSGLCQQQNMNSTFGKIEIFNNDSIRLSAVDQTGAEVTGTNFYAGAPYKYNPSYSPFRLPQAVADVITINENDSSALINVLANDIDLNGYPLFANLLTNPAHGTATLGNNNLVTYVPDTGYYGVDTFHYLACDHSNPICPNCAEAEVTINISHVTGIREVQNAVSFHVYPNPADESVYITSSNTTPVTFELLNILGQHLTSLNFIGNTTLDVSKYAPGNYFYNIVNNNNQILKVGRIVVFR